MWQKSYDGSPTLYLVPTPIGNLEDITYRAINTLKSVDVIFSEDTRETMVLLNYYNIKNKLICLEEHNEDIKKETILEYLENNKSVALVTDRGTPIISDPGYKSVKYITDKGYNVVSLPGPTAFVPALTVSALPPSPFLFYGFLNSKQTKRREELTNLKDIDYSVIFYEAPHRILKLLEDMLLILGDRNISISREISKKYESIYRGTINNAINNLDVIKGEYVIVVEAGIKKIDNIDYLAEVENEIKRGFSVSNAIKNVASKYNINKNELYRKYHGGNV